MSDREEFENNFPVPEGVEFNEAFGWYQAGVYSEPSVSKYNATWRGWKAARAQEGGEAVAEYEHYPRDGVVALFPLEGFNRLPDGHGLLYTRSSASVLDGWGEWHTDEAAGWTHVRTDALKRHLTQPADNWIKCSERLPIEADADFEGGIYTWNWKTKAIHKLQV